ncbi:MAG TPA: group III truncated hemoglobin [Roseimicrobium sp.]|nr:group III truncated hemoglobin [Roseimicrobium sp.]
MSDERSLYERLGGHEGILKLIQSFYVDARQHAVLGLIFNSQIKDWPSHLAKITEFWALQTGGPSLYRGGFAAAHLRIPAGLDAEHFQDWVGLWELNNGRHLPPREAAEMNALAHEFARRLFGIVQGRKG